VQNSKKKQKKLKKTKQGVVCAFFPARIVMEGGYHGKTNRKKESFFCSRISQTFERIALIPPCGTGTDKKTDTG
jgi:hypothetical protein